MEKKKILDVYEYLDLSCETESSPPFSSHSLAPYPLAELYRVLLFSRGRCLASRFLVLGSGRAPIGSSVHVVVKVY